jgi:CO/xanthine dehydrogenase FAD-binding subunit
MIRPTTTSHDHNQPLGGGMTDLRYEAPETLQAAVALLAGASGPARVLAGGTDVIVQMETDLIEPSLLVDIKKPGRASSTA